MGAGPDLSGWDSPYPYVIDSLQKQGLINSRAFTLDIRHIGDDRASVIFGGIDTKKYTGALEKRPIIPASESPDGYTRFWIYLDGINISQDGKDTEIFSQVNGVGVLLDSGYTLSAMPSAIFQKILAQFPDAKKVPNSDDYEVPCSLTDSDGVMEFVFGATTIQVPLADFIRQQPEYNACYLGVFEDDGEQAPPPERRLRC
jgi:hypothetical protein